MALPEKREDLVAMGYVFDNEGVCSRCHAPIEWWVTPHNKKMPMRVFPLDANGEVIVGASLTPVREYVRRPHFADCPFREEFRRPK